MTPPPAVVLDRETAWTNLAQTARMLGIDRSTLSKQVRAGRVHCVKLGLGRGSWIVPPQEVLRLANVYRRVPVQEVQRKLAHEMAIQMRSDEGAVIHALEHLHAVSAAALTPAQQEEAKVNPALLSAHGSWADQGSMARMETPTTTSVIDFGRLRPRRMHADEVPSTELLQAMDSRHPRQPTVQVSDSNPPVVDFGRLRPGMRL